MVAFLLANPNWAQCMPGKPRISLLTVAAKETHLPASCRGLLPGAIGHLLPFLGAFGLGRSLLCGSGLAGGCGEGLGAGRCLWRGCGLHCGATSPLGARPIGDWAVRAQDLQSTDWNCSFQLWSRIPPPPQHALEISRDFYTLAQQQYGHR